MKNEIKIYKENDKSRSICETCGLVTTTFKTRDVPITGSKVTVRILAGVCDSCDSVISIPHQSSEQIKNAISEEE